MNLNQIETLSQKLQNYLYCFTDEPQSTLCDFGSIKAEYIGVCYRDSGSIIGYALGYKTLHCNAPILWIEDLFVEEEHRGKGIGKKILAKVSKIGLEQKCGGIGLNTLVNLPDFEFYTHLGAVPISTYYCLDLA